MCQTQFWNHKLVLLRYITSIWNLKWICSMWVAYLTNVSVLQYFAFNSLKILKCLSCLYYVICFSNLLKLGSVVFSKLLQLKKEWLLDLNVNYGDIKFNSNLSEKKCRVRTPGIFPIYMFTSLFGAVTFECNWTKIQIIGFIIYHVEDMVRYLRNCHARTPCRVRTPQFVQTTKLPIMMFI